MLRKKGMDVREATALIEGKSVSWKNELLFSEHINYNDLPCWQKRGVGIYYSIYVGDCETGLVFDVQKRQTPDFVGDKQEK